MKISERWLREWIDLPLTVDAIAEQLTNLGIEIEGIAPVAPPFQGVVVGEVLEVIKHPDADKLRVCKVKVGENAEPLTIVCGAANVRSGIKVPAALVGAVLPGGMQIKKAKLRGVESFGMLCSAVELGIAETSEGLLELDSDAPIGHDIRKYLDLDDQVIEIKVTPNRGDCLSVLGIARELSAANGVPLKKPNFGIISANATDIDVSNIDVIISGDNAKAACPHYAGRVIKGINNKLQSPFWLRERLRRSGLRSISPVVDVTNYVMLELGQPLHAFDLAKIDKWIEVRFACSDESITVLDGREIKLNVGDLVIADAVGRPLALAGIMGGSFSSIIPDTANVFFESAYFDPDVIRKSVQAHNLHTDSSYRFERGVDYLLQREALDRAAQLLLQIAGGTSASSATEETAQEFLPKAKTIKLRKSQIQKILGIDIADDKIVLICNKLNLAVKAEDDGWQISTPSYRFDLAIEEDLLEEIARINGYDAIESQAIVGLLQASDNTGNDVYLDRAGLSNILITKGYNEIITYSFINSNLQKLLDPKHEPQKLLPSPLGHDLVMRTNLWPGLIKAALHNLVRQRNRMRLFEVGLCFNQMEGELVQSPFIAGLVLGEAYPLQWGEGARDVDFFDVKNDVDCLLRQFGHFDDIKFVAEAEMHPALHPRRSAKIYAADVFLGEIGELHPKVQQQLDIPRKMYVYDINLSLLINMLSRNTRSVSKFPTIQRDLALVMPNDVNWQQIKDKILAISGKILQYIQVFDVYCGSGINKGYKSIAVRLVFLDESRTLTDDEVDGVINNILVLLKETFNVKLRG